MAGLGVYQAPTFADDIYDLVGSAYGGLHRLAGASERDAAFSGGRARRALSDTVETLFMPAAAERSGRQILRGKGTLGDAGTVALASLPVTGKYAVRGVKAALPAIKAITPAPVREVVGAVGDYLGHVPEMVAPEWFGSGGAEVSMPGSKVSPTLRVKGAPSRSLTVPGVRRVPAEGVEVPTAPLALAGRAARPLVEGPDIAAELPYTPTRELNVGPKIRGGQWFPDADIPEVAAPIPATAEEAGWFVHDRGEHAPPSTRYMTRRGDDTNTAYYTHTPERAWGHARTEHQYERDFGAPVDTFNYSPEQAARTVAFDLPWETSEPVRDWLQKSLSKYYKRDFGTEADPVASLLTNPENRWDPAMTPERWRQAANSVITEDPIGYHTVPKFGMPQGKIEHESSLGPGLLAEIPALAKAPVTDPIYGMTLGTDFGEGFLDEVPNLFDPASDLPPRFKFDIGKADRVTLPQAAQRIGEVAKYRRQLAAEAAKASLNHPAISPFKEYPDDPRGMRWVEVKPPALGDHLLSDEDRALVKYAEENGNLIRPETLDEIYRKNARDKVDEALKYESDQLSHCVGKDEHGYCNAVMRGDSRIFSLRDAEGKPYTTIETQPGQSAWDSLGSGAIPDESELGDVWNDFAYGQNPDPRPFKTYLQEERPDLYAAHPEVFEPGQGSIEQIKAYKNGRPAEDLAVQPYISDFVKSGDWGNVGDLGHSNLMRVPGVRPGGTGRRYIDRNDVYNVLKNLPTAGEFGPTSGYYWQDMIGEGTDTYGRSPKVPTRFEPKDWEALEPHFEGYAKGGPVRSHGVDPDLVERASERYPFIRDLDPALVEGDHLETWAPGEPGSEGDWRPGEADINRLAVQGPRGMPVEDFVGETLHADPRAIATRDALWSTLTPEQTERLKREAGDYAVTLERGGTEDRAMQNAVDSLIRGYTVKQWPQEALDRFGLDEVQQGDLDALQGYMEGR